MSLWWELMILVAPGESLWLDLVCGWIPSVAGAALWMEQLCGCGRLLLEQLCGWRCLPLLTAAYGHLPDGGHMQDGGRVQDDDNLLNGVHLQDDVLS